MLFALKLGESSEKGGLDLSFIKILWGVEVFEEDVGCEGRAGKWEGVDKNLAKVTSGWIGRRGAVSSENKGCIEK